MKKNMLKRISGGFKTAESYGVNNTPYLEESAKGAKLPGLSVTFGPNSKIDVDDTLLEEKQSNEIDYTRKVKSGDVTIHKKTKTTLF